MGLVPNDGSAHRGADHIPTRGHPIFPNPRQLPSQTVEDVLAEVPRSTLTHPPVVITVTRGIDPNTKRDPSKLNDASPFFATTSLAPRTP
jgi:hypothetical protein